MSLVFGGLGVKGLMISAKNPPCLLSLCFMIVDGNAETGPPKVSLVVEDLKHETTKFGFMLAHKYALLLAYTILYGKIAAYSNLTDK